MVPSEAVLFELQKWAWTGAKFCDTVISSGTFGDDGHGLSCVSHFGSPEPFTCSY